MSKLSFREILNRFRAEAISNRHQGFLFEQLMKSYLLSDPRYEGRFKQIWLWSEFPYRHDFGTGKDVGIDLVAQTTEDEFWAIQCKFYDEHTIIDKDGVNTFLATSSKEFSGHKFSLRLWISTTNYWNKEAEEILKNQNPPVQRISLMDLEESAVEWDKLINGKSGAEARSKAKTLREHQIKALEAACEYFKTADRGKLIMACGTGKTLTSLKIAEQETDNKGIVLFLVPSIALLGQTLREWTANSSKPIYPICICSDATVGKKSQEDTSEISAVDLALPASTNIKNIVHQFELARQKHKDEMIVFFSTYQSIDVVSQAQAEINKRNPNSCVFDLTVCDEAHRTTGIILQNKEESYFTKVHNNDFIQSKKRMYMTATPRLYTEISKAKAKENSVELCSMDDPNLYGEEFYRIGFGEAVRNHLLTDYKVLIFTMKEDQIPSALQSVIADKANEITTDDVSKLIGCINALSKRVLAVDESFNDDKKHMKKAVAFCQKIKVSKDITNLFNEHKNDYYNSLSPENREVLVGVESRHIDGSMGASVRDGLLSWLKNAPEDKNECRILTNVRCLSEGVDVPSLDAVMFLSAKNSQIDVVQSVGRVMRVAPNKKYGYIIIPIVIPANAKPEEALDNNDRYSVIWTVLNALRAHDDRFNAEINKIKLNKHKSARILIGGLDINAPEGASPEQLELPLQYMNNLQEAIYAKMVKKVGTKRYWIQWANDVAEIAKRYMERIERLVNKEGKHQVIFAKLLKGMQKNLNPSINQADMIQMLAQHLITKPIFEALFENYSFAQNNPVSQSLQKMVSLLEEQAFEKDVLHLSKFYEDVKRLIGGIDNAEGKQKIIKELYENFFNVVFPETASKLGIVYTPIEVVDFINHSVAQVLKKEFGRDLSDENVHILDPFTGTGTFITRLIQTGLISKDALPRKYAKELHANEIVLLAYYIASINIENAYHDAVGQQDGYKPFNGICLTDTFQLGETDEADALFSDMLPQNSERVLAQKKLPVRVIIGNPPYSIGQDSENDNAKNQSYPKLEERIKTTYVQEAVGNSLKKGLYDSYVKAFRWSSDRLNNEHGGIVAFVSNAQWLDNNSFDGFRKCLEREFSSIYVFNLRGNCRTSGETRRKEAGNIFDQGCRTPISITILVKKSHQINKKANIYYMEVADYMTKEEKLDLVKQYKGILNSKIPLKVLKPNTHGDWLNQRSDLFGTFIPIGGKEKSIQGFFNINSGGVVSGKDAWVYNFSANHLMNNIQRMINFYNSQVIDYKERKKTNPRLKINDFIDRDGRKIKWVQNLIGFADKGFIIKYSSSEIRQSSYRPFCKQYSYFSKEMNWSRYLQPSLFPIPEIKNRSIAISGVGSGKDFSALIVNQVSCLDMLEKSQCFPLYYYEENTNSTGQLFETDTNKYIRRDGLTDFILKQCQDRYGNKVAKEHIFYYVYGLLHSPEYKTQFAADLKKMLPRIPLVEVPEDFWAFSKLGKELAELHLNYETVPALHTVRVIGTESNNFKVEKLRFAKMGKEDDKSTIIYNSSIRIENIPLEAYEYVVNGKSAIEWIMERYQVKIDKDSGIKNDPNDWGLEHDNPRYILDLLLSIITVSMETRKIVNKLPKLEFKES
ncbi:MAG: DEAD/DEAH box helicase family protein [Spirochaetota bacterium]|uniref:DEAD/DEAH box helicase n=1 Tax=Candidatus Avelusimicrobium faecicola TaxID=3416205 RepID=UPI002A65C7A7|nr:DEAD/DEAH box helicase family protein [Spirochaetota bacterium]